MSDLDRTFEDYTSLKNRAPDTDVLKEKKQAVADLETKIQNLNWEHCKFFTTFVNI